MPRPGLLQRLQRRAGLSDRPVVVPWNELLAHTLARLLRCRHGARARADLSLVSLAARDLGDDAAVRRLCDELARGVPRLEPRLTRLLAAVLSRDDAGVIRLRVEAHAATEEVAACIVRLSPLRPAEIHRVP